MLASTSLSCLCNIKKKSYRPQIVFVLNQTQAILKQIK